MKRLLIVDDDDAMRRLVRLNLSDNYEIIDTGDPEQALALTMEHKPDASNTQPVPVFLVSGEPAADTGEVLQGVKCRGLF